MERLAFGGLAAAAILRRHIVGLGKSAVAENEPQPGSDDAEVKLEQNNILSLEQIVNIAGQLAQYVRAEYIFGPTKLVFEKEDTSPVTVADLAIQVLVTTLLKHIQRTDDKIRLVGEESPAMFTDGANAEAMEVIVELVARFLPSGVAESPISADFVMQALAEGNDQGGDGTFWTLDPIDGTKGFVLEGGQYAIGLALVQEGRVVRSVIGCPVLSSAYVLGDPRQQGCIYSATRGGGAFVHAVEDDGSLGPAKPCRVPAAPQNRSNMKLAESRAHNVGVGGVLTAVGAKMGFSPRAVAIDSMVKYALVVRGEAHVYARVYHHIWDFAPGCLLIEEAGGRVSDVMGADIDFAAHGRSGQSPFIVATCDVLLHEEVLETIQSLTTPKEGSADPANRRISISDCD